MITIEKIKGGVTKKFIFENGEVKSVGKPTNNAGISITIPTTDLTAVSQVTIDLGVNKDLNFNFKIYKQTNDRSDGTHTSTKTYGEILDYLENVIAFPGIGKVDYKIIITDKFRTQSAYYSFESFNTDVDSGLYPTGNFRFKFNRLIT